MTKAVADMLDRIETEIQAALRCAAVLTAAEREVWTTKMRAALLRSVRSPASDLSEYDRWQAHSTAHYGRRPVRGVTLVDEDYRMQDFEPIWRRLWLQRTPARKLRLKRTGSIYG